MSSSKNTGEYWRIKKKKKKKSGEGRKPKIT